MQTASKTLLLGQFKGKITDWMFQAFKTIQHFFNDLYCASKWESINPGLDHSTSAVRNISCHGGLWVGWLLQ